MVEMDYKERVGSFLRIKLPQDYKQEQTKMTRQEAIMKMPMGFENLPAALEALGLITFDKERDKPSKETIWKVCKSWQDFEACLCVNGYKIIKEQT